jgi:hypothetical protein
MRAAERQGVNKRMSYARRYGSLIEADGLSARHHYDNVGDWQSYDTPRGAAVPEQACRYRRGQCSLPVGSIASSSSHTQVTPISMR